MIAIPKAEELSVYYRGYLKYADAGADLVHLIRQQKMETAEFLASVSEERASKAYAPDKWLLKEVVGHICDTERILAYRALRIARNDKTPMAVFDENAYTPASNYHSRTLKNIGDELLTVRYSTISLIENFSPEMILRKGIASGQEVSVGAVIFFIYAHQQHHLNVIKEKYLT